MTTRLGACLVAAAAMLYAGAGTAAAICSAESSAQRVPLLELYTSEGCDSCPPADRWVSGLRGRGFGPDRVVTLAFHVDYWNHLGWPDPFAKAEYSERQRATSARDRAPFVYTPQLVLNGRGYRRGLLRDDLGERVQAINRASAPAAISLNLTAGTADTLSVSGAARVPDRAARRAVQAYVALYENNLATHVTAGENRGKRLQHDFVVRELAGPFALGPDGAAQLDHVFRLEGGWKRGDLQVAAFVQDGLTGDVLQALALGPCSRL